MQELKNYIYKLKRDLIQRKKETEIVQKRIKEAILNSFQEEKVLNYIRTFYIKKDTLFIEATSKVIAQELFWRSDELLKEINQSQVNIRKIKII